MSRASTFKSLGHSVKDVVATLDRLTIAIRTETRALNQLSEDIDQKLRDLEGDDLVARAETARWEEQG